MSIPKIIHYCWFGGNEVPEKDRRCIESWKKYCPDYEIIQWNEQNYDVTQNQYMKEAYESGRWAFVTDYARLDIVYRFGGVYLDTDVEIIRSFDELLELNGFAGIEKGTKYLALGLGFGAVEGNLLIKELRDIYATRHFIEDGEIDLTPNPQIMTEYINDQYSGILRDEKIEIQDGFFIYPTEYFCPQDYDTGKTVITQKTFSIHHYHDSWKTPQEKAQINEYKRYTRVFGEKNGERIYRFVVTVKAEGFGMALKKTKGFLTKK